MPRLFLWIGMFMPTGYPRRIEFTAAAIALLVVSTLLQRGLSALDDGYYLWIAQRLLQGDILHLDIRSMHPGYAFYLDAALLRWFGNDVAVLRYPLPPLAAVTVLCTVRLARPAGPWTQWVIGIAGICLGTVQFITPSASWYATALASAAMLAFHFSSRATGRCRAGWLLCCGLLVGLTCGFRHTNGALLGAALVLVHVMAAPLSHNTGPKRRKRNWRVAAALLSAVTLLLLPTLATATVSAWLLTLPCVVFAALALRRWRTDGPVCRLKPLMGVAAAALVGFLPVLVIPIQHGASRQFLVDTVFDAFAYTHYSELRGIAFTGLVTDALELFGKPGPTSVFNGVYMIAIVLMPMALAMALIVRRRALREPHAAALGALAMVFMLNQISFQGLIYSFFWLPTAIASIFVLLADGPRVRLAGSAVMLAAAAVLVMHGGQLAGANQANLFAARTPQVRCPLPRCSLWVDAGAVGGWKADVDDLIRHVPSNRPLMVLPMGPTLYGFLPHRSPWQYGFVIDGFTPQSHIDGLAAQLRDTPTGIVAVETRAPSGSGRSGQVTQLIAPLCLDGRSTRFAFYSACAGNARPVDTMGNAPPERTRID